MHSMSKEDTVSAIDWQTVERPLDSIILPGNLAATVGEMIREWRATEKLARFGLKPRNRMLLHGPSGNGKTALAAAIATELDVPLAYVRYSELISKWVGHTHQNLARVFRESATQPCVLFFDEADSICSSRSSSEQSSSRERNLSVNTLLLELDRLSDETVAIFATNLPDMLDAAMRRRISITMELPAPDLDDLRRLVATIRSKNPLLPLADFKVEECGATSFAQCEQLAIDHARRIILDMDDPLGMAGKPRSAWLRERIQETLTAAS